MPQFVARFLSFVLLAAAFAPLTAHGTEKTVLLSITAVTQSVMAHSEGNMIHPSNFAEWGLLLADVLLAIVAIFIAIAAFFSYSIVSSGAKRAAQETAREEMKNFLKSGDMKAMVKEAVWEEGNPTEKDTGASSVQDSEEDSG